MLEGFNPTKKERAAIDKAWRLLLEKTRDPYRSEQFLKDERRGYGNANDRIPLAAAQGLCVKWFLKGVEKPDALLRNFYFCRPAAIWFQGMGAYESQCNDGITTNALALMQAGVDAYNAAFDRMINRDVAALDELARDLNKREG